MRSQSKENAAGFKRLLATMLALPKQLLVLGRIARLKIMLVSINYARKHASTIG